MHLIGGIIRSTGPRWEKLPSRAGDMLREVFALTPHAHGKPACRCIRLIIVVKNETSLSSSHGCMRVRA